MADSSRICQFFLRGRCQRQNCEFRHSYTDTPSNFFVEGRCRIGVTCRFKHDKERRERERKRGSPGRGRETSRERSGERRKVRRDDSDDESILKGGDSSDDEFVEKKIALVKKENSEMRDDEERKMTDINCLLCRGSISFTVADHSWYEDHLIVEHGVLFYIPWIIEKTLQVCNAQQYSDTKGKDEAMITHWEKVTPIPVTSSKKEPEPDNESVHLDDRNGSPVYHAFEIKGSPNTSSLNDTASFGHESIHNDDTISVDYQSLDCERPAISPSRVIDLEVILPKKNLTDMSRKELLELFRINNFKLPALSDKKTPQTKRLISMLKSKLIDTVTGRLMDAGVMDELNKLIDNNIVTKTNYNSRPKRRLGILRNALKHKCPYWIQELQDILNDDNIISNPADLKASTLYQEIRGGRKLICNICPGDNGFGRAFLSASNLKCHVKTHLPFKDRQTFQCELCKESYMVKASLENHILTCKELHACQLHSEMFYKKCELFEHKLVHKESERNIEVCVECGQTYKLLQNHVKHCLVKKGKPALKVHENFPELARGVMSTKRKEIWLVTDVVPDRNLQN